MKDMAPVDEARQEIAQEVQERFKVISDRLQANSDWTSLAAQADMRRMVALCWPNIDFFSRSKFITFLDSDWLFNPPPEVKPETLADLELMNILKIWSDVLPGLEGKERQFAMDVDKRRRWRNWKPTEKQVEWIKVIYATHVQSVGMDPAVMDEE